MARCREVPASLPELQRLKTLVSDQTDWEAFEDRNPELQDVAQLCQDMYDREGVSDGGRVSGDLLSPACIDALMGVRLVGYGAIHLEDSTHDQPKLRGIMMILLPRLNAT